MKCEQCGFDNKGFHRSGAIARWKGMSEEDRKAAMQKVRTHRHPRPAKE